MLYVRESRTFVQLSISIRSTERDRGIEKSYAMKRQGYKSIKSWKSKLFYSALLSTVSTSLSRWSLETVWVMVVSFAFRATFTLLSKHFHSTGIKFPQYRS